MQSSSEKLNDHDADNQALIQAMREYQELIAAGGPLDLRTFFHKYPAIADDLRDCIDGWELLQDATSAPESLFAQSETMPLGDYQLKRVIGRGGMGTVHEAVQLSLSKRVAVKVLDRAAAMDVRRQRRFQVEIQIASLLSHPNIVPVLGVGYDRGLHYYAMHFVDGCGLDAVLRDLRDRCLNFEFSADKPSGRIDGKETRRWESTSWGASLRNNRERTSAELCLSAAEALVYAHRNGVIHRDIKPSNLLVDIEGHLWVTDFGLARFCDGDRLTRSEDVLGTLRYMSPEQFQGPKTIVDQRTDIYSLGATLFELITLEPFVSGDSPAAIQAELVAPMSTRRFRRYQTMSIDMRQIVGKATAHIREDRYQSAAEMAADLKRYLARQPISTRTAGFATTARRWAQRRIGLVATITAATIVASFIAVWIAVLYWRHSELAQQHSAVAIRAEERAKENLLQAQHAIETYLSIVADDPVLRRRDMVPLRRQLLGSAIEYYDQLLTGNPRDSVELKINSANAGYRLGILLMNIGDYDRAADRWLKTAEFFEELETDQPSDVSHGLNRVLALENAGNSFLSIFQISKAEHCLNEAKQLLAVFRQKTRISGKLECLMEARIHYQLGRLNFSRHEFEAARKNSRQAISLAQEWVDADGDTRDFRHLQEYQSLYGYALIELDQAEKGVRLIESALREMERIAASPEDEFTLAIHEALFASQLMELNLPKAIALGSDAVDRHYKLLIRDNVDYDIAMHASAAGMLSQALMKAGRLDEAEQILNSEGLAHPDRAEGRETMHSSTAISDWLVARGILQQKKGNHEKAIQCFRDAIQLLLTPNREIAIDWVLLPIQIQLAESLLQNEDNENAIDETRTAIQLMRRLIPVRQATPQLYHGDRKLFLDVASLCSKLQLYDELLSLMSDVFGNAIDDKVIVQSGLALISRALADDTNELRRCEWEQLSASLVDMQKRCRRQDSK